MKKILIALSAAAISAATSCDEHNALQTISVTATIIESGLEEGIRPESYSVTFSNYNTGRDLTVVSENGIAVAEGLLPGVYNVSASATCTADGTSYSITGSANNVSLVADGENIDITVFSVRQSALIFKEIYYTGAPGDAYYFRDQFYEIYNNSDETVYADGLHIAETIFCDGMDFSLVFDYDIPEKEKYVFVQEVYRIPGDGTTYPVAPGESIIIAQWATDHKAEPLSNGTSPVNLSGAEFEAFKGESTTTGGITITDENAINLTMAVNAKDFNTAQWLTPTDGSRYILFSPSTPLRTDNFIAPSNVASTFGKLAVEVLMSDVLDGVEAIPDETRIATLGLPDAIDAGYVIGGSAYSGKSISRKIKETRPDGRVIYQDTNNSKNDFEVNPVAEIRRNGAKAPSWNTWNR